MKKFYLFAIILGGVVFAFPSKAITADHLVISQVQITGGAGKTTNDFVEIYNPTSGDIDLNGIRLVKRTKTGTTDTPIKSWANSKIIKARGFYLWANSAFTDIAITPDATTTASIADDNGVALRQGANDTGTIIDSVAWGEAANAFTETAVFATNPAANQSMERSEDTNNNAADFFLQNVSHPRNSQSAPSSSPAESGGVATTTPAVIQFGVEISEIFPNPAGTDSGSEWVELYNGGSGDFDLTGWYLDDDGSEDSPGKNAYQLSSGTKLLGLSYLAITIPKGKFALNNSSDDAARLFDADKKPRLRQAYGAQAKSGFAYAKTGENQWQWTQTPSPGKPNEFEAATSGANTLRISEILPDPDGDDSEDEFIELYNYGPDSVDLSDWVAADSRKRYTITEEDFFDTETNAGGYFVLYREITGIALNNSGEEEVQLFNPAGELIHKVSFTAKSREGMSYSWSEREVYQWSKNLTPGKKNKIIPVSDNSEPPAQSKKSASPSPPEPVEEQSLAEGQVAGAQLVPQDLPRTGIDFRFVLPFLAYFVILLPGVLIKKG